MESDPTESRPHLSACGLTVPVLRMAGRSNEDEAKMKSEPQGRLGRLAASCAILKQSPIQKASCKGGERVPEGKRRTRVLERMGRPGTEAEGAVGARAMNFDI